MGKMSLLGMGVIEVRGSDTCWRGREGLDTGFRRNDGYSKVSIEGEGLRGRGRGSGEGVPEEFDEVAGAVAGAMFDLLAAGDAHDGDFPIVAFGFDEGEEFLASDGH